LLEVRPRAPAPAPAPRAARPALEAEKVVRAALDVLDEVGLDDLSMRRLAEALGVQNPALYWHVRNKQELLDRMAQVLLAEGFGSIEAEGPEPRSWTKRIERLARGMRAAMSRRRDGGRLLAAAQLTLPGSVMLEQIESVVTALMRDGFQASDALGGVLTVVHYTFGATLEEQADPRPRQSAPVFAPDPALPTLSAIAAAHGHSGRLSSPLDERFRLGVELIIDGLRARKRRARA
jgi:TetR/AcrR family tetracycline transcriptional repressor